MTKKPTLLADVAELRNVLSAMDVWEAAGGELGTEKGRRSFVDGLTPDVADELAGLALTGLLRTVLAERGRPEEELMADERAVRDDERAASAESPASEVCGTVEHPVTAGIPVGDLDVAYPPRQRSCRVIAAGWLRRRSEPLGSAQPAVPVGAATGYAVASSR
ncbi:hypothetical protein HC031_30015 [Planosporangium thailandense]|uniref:Uncharacterized protein n=1 Tax=Planosporangium thailandense TaxID=765197 RepID=A0ABX0Y952_9ACTN|nr:hypothetical protein [Planosporangium thailandense]NJC73917.1 hypothetical protein [Planosporangium thailandense]